MTTRQRVAAQGRQVLAQALAQTPSSQNTIDQLATQLQAHFTNDVQTLLDMSKFMFMEVMRDVVAATHDFALIGNKVMTPVQMTQHAAALQSRWDRWYEQNDRGHIRLMEATRADLLYAAERREKQARTQFAIAAVWRQMAAQMNESQRVQDVFTAAGIDAIVQQVAPGIMLDGDGRAGTGMEGATG